MWIQRKCNYMLFAETNNAPQWPPFTQPTGPQTTFPADATPESFFHELFTSEVWDLLLDETNRYAQHRIRTTPPSRRGVLANWYDTCREETMAFVGLILMMGILQLPDIKDYWSTHEVLNLSFFRYIYIITLSSNSYTCMFYLQISDVPS